MFHVQALFSRQFSVFGLKYNHYAPTTQFIVVAGKAMLCIKIRQTYPAYKIIYDYRER